jgi:hypothetical protein
MTWASSQTTDAEREKDSKWWNKTQDNDYLDVWLQSVAWKENQNKRRLAERDIGRKDLLVTVRYCTAEQSHIQKHKIMTLANLKKTMCLLSEKSIMNSNIWWSSLGLSAGSNGWAVKKPTFWRPYLSSSSGYWSDCGWENSNIFPWFTRDSINFSEEQVMKYCL